MPLNEFDEILKSGTVPNSGNRYLNRLQEENPKANQVDAEPNTGNRYYNRLISQKSGNNNALKESFYVANQRNPDEYADVIKLAKQYQVQPSIVEKDVNRFSDDAAKNSVNYANVVENTPALAEWLKSGDNASIGRDDIPSLSKIDVGTRFYIKRSKKLNPVTYAADLIRSARIGFNDLQSSAIMLQVAYGMADPQEAALSIAENNKTSGDLRNIQPDYILRFQELLEKNKDDVDAAKNEFLESYDSFRDLEIRKGLKQVFGGGGATVGQFIDLLSLFPRNPTPAATVVFQNLSNSAPSLVAGGLGAAAGTLLAGPLGTLVGASTLGTAGFLVGTFFGSLPVEIGASLNEDLANRGYNLQNPDDLVRAFSDPDLMGTLRSRAERKGLGTATVDTIGNIFAGKFLSATRGTNLLRRAVSATKEVGVQTVFEGAGEFAGQVARGGLTEASLGEAAIEMGAALGHSVGDIVIGNSVRATLPSNPVRAVDQVIEQTQKATDTVDGLNNIKELGDAVAESKTNARSSDAVKELIDTAAGGSDVASVFFQTDDWDNFWSSRGKSPAKAAEQILGESRNYFESKQTKAPFEIPLSDFLTKVSTAEEFNEILGITRTQVDGPTLVEAQSFLNNLPATMEELATEVTAAETPIEEQVETIKDDIKQKFVDAGFDEAASDRQADLISSFFRSVGQRANVEPIELYNQNLPTIEREGVNFELTPERRQEIIEGARSATAEALPQGVLFQAEPRDIIPKGFFDPARNTVTILKDSDFSTSLHEFSHFFFKVFREQAGTETATQQLKDDFQTLLNFVGVESADQIQRSHEEKLSQAFEKYLAEGKAPSTALQRAFARFRVWLASVYRGLRTLNVELSNDVRDVFNRMLATDQELQANQIEQDLFIDPEVIGLRGKDLDDYITAREEAFTEARQILDKRVVADFQKEKRKFVKEQRDIIRGQVEQEIHASKEYIALSILQRGKMPDGSPIREGIEPFKISKDAIVDSYGNDFLKTLPRPFIYTAKEGGLHQDAAANILGYESGDHLLRTMQNLQPQEKAIETITEAKLLQRLGDPIINGKISDEALEAIHNDKKSFLLRKELEILSRKDLPVLKDVIRRITRPVPKIERVRQIAEQTIAGKRVRDIRPNAYRVAEVRSAREAGEALARGDFDGAFLAKERQLLNAELFRAATNAKAKTNSIVNYVARFNTKPVRERLGKAGGDYLDQIDSLMERFEFKRSISLREIDKRKSLSEWIEEQRQEGLDPVIPQKLLVEAYKKSYKDLSFIELEELENTIRNIDHFSRLKNKLLKAKEQRDFNLAADSLEASIIENAKGKKKKIIETRLPKDELPRTGASFLASMRKMSSLAYQVDGFKEGGALWELLVRGANDAGNQEAVLNETSAKRLSEIFSAYSFKEKLRLYKQEQIPEIGQSLSKMGRLMVALNWGNLDNRQKLMDGYKWNEEQVKAILDGLDERDWNFVQNIWDYLDTFWPEIEAVSKRVNGVSPGRVQPAEVETKFGTFRGGYFRLKYDDRQAQKAEINMAKEAAERSLRGAAIRSTTAHGHRESRVEGVKLPVRLDFGVIFEHIGEVIHDLTHYEYLIDANKILRDARIESSIKDFYGDIRYKEFQMTVNDIAAGQTPAQNGFERIVNHLRAGTSIGGMAWNLSTALLQPFGLTQSFVRIGPKWVARGISRWMGDAARMERTSQWIYRKSDFMRLRGKTQLREISEIRNKLSLRGLVLGDLENGYFWLIVKMQQAADFPTWLGAYEKAMSEMKNEGNRTLEDIENRAVAIADQTVLDTQGGGQIKDLARIQRGGPLLKLWTNFYSFFNTTFNLTSEAVGRTNFKSAKSVGRLAADFLMLYTIPASLAWITREALRGGLDDDMWEELARENMSFMLSTMVGAREISGVVQGFHGYDGPAGVRFFADLGGLVKQIEQGEMDPALWRSLNKTAGTLFHYPSVFIERIFRGITALVEGKTVNPNVIFLGPPPKK